MYYSKFSTISIIILYTIALMTVLLSVISPTPPTVLYHMTQENSFFESFTVVLLLFMFFYGFKTLYYHKSDFSVPIALAIFFFSIVCFLAGMEEISWGQHIFHFESSDYFLEENLQKETNLHNLVDPTYFSSFINTFVYDIFVYLPLTLKIFPILKEKFKFLKHFELHEHTILIALFSSIFIAFGYDNTDVFLDSIAHGAGLLMFAIYLLTTKRETWVKIHYIFIVLATLFSISSCHVYSFDNMQYEIREMFIVLTSLFVFMEVVKRYIPKGIDSK